MNRFLFCLLLIIVAGTRSFEQAPVVEWQHSYGNYEGDFPHRISITKDGGFIAIGGTEVNGGDVVGVTLGSRAWDCWVIKMNSRGNIEWKRVIGTFNFEDGYDIKQTIDGGYVIAGVTAGLPCEQDQSTSFLLLKITASGEVEWQRKYGGSKNEYCYTVQLTSDGGYMLAGRTESGDGDITGFHGGNDWWLVKTDNKGNLQWQKTFGGSGDEEPHSLELTSDGGYIMAGYTNSTDGDVIGNHGLRDVWVVKLDNAGNIQFKKCLGGSRNEEAFSIKQTTDGGYILAGFTNSEDGDASGLRSDVSIYSDCWLVKLDITGAVLWQQCHGGNSNDRAYDVDLTAKGGYIVCGVLGTLDGDSVCNGGVEDCWVFETDNTGALVWQKTLGGSYFDEGFCIKTMPDGSYVMLGNTCSDETAGYHSNSTAGIICGDFWVVKLSLSGASNPSTRVTIDPKSATICNGNATLKTDIRYAGTNYTISWKRDGQETGITTPTYTGSDFKVNEQLICTVTRGNDCDIDFDIASDTIFLSANTSIINPSITITSDTKGICTACTPVSFKANVTAGASNPLIQWFVNDFNTGWTGVFFNTNQLKPGDSVKCYYTDTVACLMADTLYSNTIKILQATGLVPAVSINASKNGVCKNTLITFSAIVQNAGANPTYQWKVNGVNAGTNSASFTISTLNNQDKVSCIITKDPALNCISANSATSNTITVALLTPQKPSLSISTPYNYICKGTSVSFYATAINAGSNIAYTWKINGFDQAVNNNTFITQKLADGDTIVCKIMADTSAGCFTIDTAISNKIVMYVNNAQETTLHVQASAIKICYGTDVQFDATAINAIGTAAYQWKLNSRNIGGNSPSFSSSLLKNGDSVSCVLVNGSSCSQAPVISNIIVMQVISPAEITCMPTDTLVFPGTIVQFRTTVSKQVKSFTWTPASQLENSLLLSPSTMPVYSKTAYTILVEDVNGCLSEKKVTVNVGIKLYMPNAFTPSGDGKNEVFRIPPGTNILLTEFSVFDRWGKLVFSTSDKNKGWDGKSSGKPANAGTYIYYIKGKDEKGPVVLKGAFVLLR